MKRIFNCKLLFVLFAVLFLVIPSDVFAVTEGPSKQLEPVLKKIMSVLADEHLLGDENRQARRLRVMTAVAEGFDFNEMSRRVLGKTWRDISEKDRIYFTKLMTTMLENTYMDRLEAYSGETVVFDGERIRGNKAQVDTIVSDGRITIPVNYIMILQEDARWLVYDINIEGVSLVRNYQEQFKSILRNDDFSELVKLLEEKNQSFSTNK